MNDWMNTRIFGFQTCGHPRGGQTEWIASKAVLKKTRSRILIVLALFFVFYGVIIARMTHLTLANEIASLEAGDEPVTNENAQSVINIRRGDILDRNGNLLATSLSTSSLYADPKMIWDADEAARKLISVFPDLTYDDMLKKLQSKRRFIWLKRNLTPKQVYAANRLGIPGVNFLEESRRVYPYGSLTAHVMGYADVDGKGLAGVERAMDNALLQSKADLVTTIDIRMQHILHRELVQSISDFKAIGGAGMIMDVHTGEILAMTSMPDFDPHYPGRITDAERFNRNTLGAYEMGSTFKTFTMAAMMEYARMPLTTRLDTVKPLRRSGFTIRDYHPEKYPMNVSEIFLHSSNVGTALIAERVGTHNMKKFYNDLGFFDKPIIEIKETAAPIIPSTWREINTITASYGHGIAVTPVHLASAFASMTNGGYKIAPTLIKRSPETYNNARHERVVSQETSDAMRRLLRIVVSDGTGRKADVKGYRIGGKTGTAEKTLGRGYSKNAQIASFVSVFPVDNPRFVVMMMVDEPKGNKKSYGFATAGWVAVPYVGNVIKNIAPLAGIKPERDDQLAVIRASVGLTPDPQHQAKQGGRLASF